MTNCFCNPLVVGGRVFILQSIGGGGGGRVFILQSIGGGGRVFILRNLSNYLEDAHQMDEMDGCFLSTFPGENADVKCKKFNA